MSTGATLSGTGTIGASTVLHGGRLSPGGAGLGTFSVDGDLVFEHGSTYAVDVTGAASDLVRVTGTATLNGGSVEVTALDAQTSYQHGHAYTILSATDGVAGAFDQALSGSAFLTTTLAYVDDAVRLGIGLVGQGDDDDGEDDADDGGDDDSGGVRPPNVFPTVALTRNQHSTATALDTLAQSGDALALYNSLLLLNADDARAAFEALSGELHASTRSALLDDRFLQTGVQQRLTGQALGLQGGSASFWLAGASTSPIQDGDGNGAGMRTRRHGLMAGLDWTVGNHALIGVALGQQRIDHWLRARQSSAQADATVAGLYAQGRRGALTLRGSLSRSDYRIDTVRDVQAGAQPGQQLRSDTDAGATTLQVEAAWQAMLGAARLSPYLAVAASRLQTDATRETGGSAALVVDGARDELLTTTAGARAAWDVSGGYPLPAVLTVGLAWQHAEGDVTGESTHRFVAGSDAFTVQAAPLARNTALAEFGIALSPTANSRLSLGAQGRRGDGRSELGVQLHWQVGL